MNPNRLAGSENNSIPGAKSNWMLGKFGDAVCRLADWVSREMSAVRHGEPELDQDSIRRLLASGIIATGPQSRKPIAQDEARIEEVYPGVFRRIEPRSVTPGLWIVKRPAQNSRIPLND